MHIQSIKGKTKFPKKAWVSHLAVLEEAEFSFLPVVAEVAEAREEQVGGDQHPDVHVKRQHLEETTEELN